MNRASLAIIGISAYILSSFHCVASLSAQGTDHDLDGWFSGGSASAQAQYKAIHFPDQPMRSDDQQPELLAQQFLEQHAHHWDLKPENLRLARSMKDWLGGVHLIYQQYIDGHPLLGAEISLHFNAFDQLVSAGGIALPERFSLSRLPQVGASRRPTIARVEPSRQGRVPTFPEIQNRDHQTNRIRFRVKEDANHKATDRFLQGFALSPYLYLKQVADPHRWSPTGIEQIYMIPSLIDPSLPDRLMAIYKLELSATDGLRVYDVYIDANTRRAIMTVPRHCSLLERRLFNESMTTPNIIWEEGDAFPGALNTDQQELIRHTEQTYNFYYRTFGRDSYDNQGGVKNIIYDPFFIDCPNANSGTGRIAVCAGVVADDVTAHEWTHTHISNTSRIIYAFESGVVNEGLADIFGEVVDLINGTGNDAGISSPRSNCIETNTRWKIGEDITALSTHIRDMAFPNCRNDPDDRQDAFYYCGTEDDGGVHINSGLINRSFVLLTDGGTHNGITVNPIGLTKATHLFAHTMFYYTTRVSDIHAFGNQLRLAAEDLIGQELLELTVDDAPAALSGEAFTAGDLLELEKAILAVEMQEPSPCQFETILSQTTPDLCSGDSSWQVFLEDWEDGLNDWTTLEVPADSNDWVSRSWVLDSLLPDGKTGKGVFAVSPYSDDCFNDLQNGTLKLISPPIGIPDTNVTFTLSFDHYFSLEEDRDGGLVFIKKNEEDWSQIQAEAFVFNGYNTELDPLLINNNPYADLWAFSGSDENSTTGSWGSSRIDLSMAGVLPGDSIQLAWHLGTDGCDGWLGWYLDDVAINACITNPLPVELLSFDAKKVDEQIDLDWETAAEVNNAGFWVERSINGQPFTSIGWIASKGSNSQYAYTDTDVSVSGTYYYRLRQLDFDGRQTLSRLVPVVVELAGPSAQIFPNPAIQDISINTVGVGLAEELNIYDLNGRLVMTELIVTQQQRVSLQDLSPGVYLVHFAGEIHRLVKL